MAVGVFLNSAQQAFFLRSEHALSEQAWNQVVKTLDDFVSNPGAESHWREFGALYATAFCQHVDTIVTPDPGSATTPPDDSTAAQQSAAADSA